MRETLRGILEEMGAAGGSCTGRFAPEGWVDSGAAEADRNPGLSTSGDSASLHCSRLLHCTEDIGGKRSCVRLK